MGARQGPGAQANCADLDEGGAVISDRYRLSCIGIPYTKQSEARVYDATVPPSDVCGDQRAAARRRLLAARQSMLSMLTPGRRTDRPEPRAAAAAPDNSPNHLVTKAHRDQGNQNPLGAHQSPMRSNPTFVRIARRARPRAGGSAPARLAGPHGCCSELTRCSWV